MVDWKHVVWMQEAHSVLVDFPLGLVIWVLTMGFRCLEMATRVDCRCNESLPTRHFASEMEALSPMTFEYTLKCA